MANNNKDQIRHNIKANKIQKKMGFVPITGDLKLLTDEELNQLNALLEKSFGRKLSSKKKLS